MILGDGLHKHSVQDLSQAPPTSPMQVLSSQDTNGSEAMESEESAEKDSLDQSLDEDDDFAVALHNANS